MTEFTKDFYRLYPLRTIKSMRDCPKSLPKLEQTTSSEQLLQKQPTKDLSDSVSKLSLQKHTSENVDEFCPNLLLQEQFTKDLDDSMSNFTLQKESTKDLDDCVSNFLLQKQSTKDINDSLSNLLLQKHSTKDMNSSVSNFSLNKQSTKDTDNSISNLSLQKYFGDLSGSVSNLLLQKQCTKDIDDPVSHLLLQKQLSNLSVHKRSNKDLDAIVKTVPLQNVECAAHSSMDTTIEIEKDKVYSEIQNMKRTKISSLKVKEPKDRLLTKGSKSENISKKQHEIPTRKSTSKVVSEVKNTQSHTSAKEKLFRHDKTKIPIKCKSPACEKSYKDISITHNNSFAKDFDKRQNIKAKDNCIKKSQSSQQILQNFRQSYNQLSDNARKDGNLEYGRPLKKSYHEAREMEKEIKDHRVFLKEKMVSEADASREDMPGRMQHNKQSVGKEFQKQEKKKVDNFEEVLNFTVADKIHHFSTLHAQSEKERLSLILQSEIQCPETCQEHFSTESSSGRRISACKQQKEAQNSGNKEGCETSWICVEADVDLSDPKARANLLDSMIASSSSDEENNGNEVQEHQHNQRLHALHRFRRQKKRASDRDGIISFIPKNRTSVLNGYEIFYRFGDKEREAVACFDFLDEFSTSPSDIGSSEILSEERRSVTPVLETVLRCLKNQLKHPIYYVILM
ncbi:uncharacterized protein LOC143226212 [Tachypleus tridentatus]|uniref:uncharacterized protein LOC143226212 n=1 Tax=Tachypleus tridentatus TaxID=6853 RepID=UPI003FD26FC7